MKFYSWPTKGNPSTLSFSILLVFKNNNIDKNYFFFGYVELNSYPQGRRAKYISLELRNAHFGKDFIKQWKDKQVKDIVWECAKRTTIPELKECMDKLKGTNDKA